ncbi:5-formyltetrahydrofolate cyclo-ligase [uncultured Martelella sp.]|uniref:5-formyltetrahydrofolate cyclo-ligase n=1 Tax=uncultured Martelella sp. TaxID=392331 RepID=UPI0029C97369|nr:5-formyltetrahydrofolate cyclo-ligase [uncultured Martelella sp.]
MLRRFFLRLTGGSGEFLEAYFSRPDETKSDLRKVLLSRRDSLSEKERRKRDKRIMHELEELFTAFEGMTVAGYWPIKSEFDPRPAMREIEKAGGKLCLPAVIDRETIVFRAYKTGDDLVKSGFGTLAPPETAEAVDPEIILIPLVGFDGTGNRLGYGAGHYDRAVADLAARGKRPRLIAPAYAVQEARRIPSEPHDQRLFGIVTDGGTRTIMEVVEDGEIHLEPPTT